MPSDQTRKNTQDCLLHKASIQQGNNIIQERNEQQLYTTEKPTPTIDIYISSAATSEDQTLLGKLENQLSMLRRQADIRFWDKRQVVPGANRQTEIDTHINQAHLILFLLSSDFLASDECYAEMEQAARRRGAGEAHVVSILMRPTADWQNTPIGELEPLPADRVPVSNRVDREEALRDIAQNIRRVIEKIRQDRSSSNDEPLRTVVQEDIAMGKRSDREYAASLLQKKMASQDFDVFLCYNRQDRSAVKQIGGQLKDRGVLPWLDEWEMRPGLPWQRELEKQISRIKMAAVFVGKNGLGPWQQMEMEAFLRRFVSTGRPVIPVLLVDAPQEPELPVFLAGMAWVDFRVEDPDPMRQLLWGITGDPNYGTRV
jgi:hypothetical protein